MMISTASCSCPGRIIVNGRFLTVDLGWGQAWIGTGSGKHELTNWNMEC